MFQVFLPSFVVYENIIKEYQEKLLQLFVKNMIHIGLKGSKCVGQPKGHDQKLIVLVVALECYLMNVLLPYFDLMIPQSKNNL